ENNKVAVTVGPLPPDAVAVEEVIGKKTNSFIYAACRKATVQFKTKDGKVHSTEVRISDPRHVQRVAFPIKGKIVVHSQCGVSVTSEKDTGVASNADLFKAIAEQAKALKEAFKKDDDAE